jgi:hypothetical protein
MAAGDLHVIGVNDGKLWHTVRFDTAGGPWQAFVDVKARAGNVGDFVDVDCAREAGGPGDAQGILHVVGVTGDGRLWHTLGPGPGAVFRDVKNVISPPREVGSFQALGCA